MRNKPSVSTALGEMEKEALDVLRLIVQQTERGRNLDAVLVERVKALEA